jgi:phage shock protein A
MALITRISRLFHADMNAVLDQIEEPEMLLKQAIREMEETLDHDERQIKLQEYEHKQLSGKEEEVKQSLTEIEDQLSLCFKSKKDDLARTLIKRKLEGQQTLKSLSRKTGSLEESIDHLKAQLKEHQSQLGSMKQKAEIFTQDNSDKSVASWSDSSFTVQDEDIEVAFLHEKQKWSQS